MDRHLDPLEAGWSWVFGPNLPFLVYHMEAMLLCIVCQLISKPHLLPGQLDIDQTRLAEGF